MVLPFCSHIWLCYVFPPLLSAPPPARGPRNFTAAFCHQMLDLKVPAFGVCLGLQGIVEYFGGELAVLDYPMHGKVRVPRAEGGGRKQ